MRILALCCLAACLFASQSFDAVAQNYPQFRGTGGRAVNDQATIPDDWQFEEAVEWKIEVEGSGWSQPIVWQDRLYVTTAVAGNGFKPKDFAGGVRNPSSMGGGSSRPDFEVEWKVVCLDAKSGKTIWSTAINKLRPEHGIHPSNSFATETPTADENGVYAYFGPSGTVVQLDHQGNVKWQQDVGVYKTNNDFGTGSSLAIHDNKLFLQLFTEESSDVMCLETTTGKTKWKQSRAGKGTSWSTPLVWQNSQRTEVVFSGGEQLDSFDPESGEKLWSINKVKAATACSVFGDENHIYFGGSDPMSKGPLYAVAAGGSGTITAANQNEKFESCAWLVPRSGPGMSTPVSNGEYILMTDRSVAACFKADDGSEVFRARLPGLSTVVACPMVIGNEVFLIDEKGQMSAVELGDEFKSRDLGSIDEIVWATPAMTDDALFVRGVDSLYKFKLEK